MFLLANFMHGWGVILSYALTIYIWIIIIRALLSWVSPDPYNPIVQILYRLTEPVLAPIRYRMPDFGGIDLSPMWCCSSFSSCKVSWCAASSIWPVSCAEVPPLETRP